MELALQISGRYEDVLVGALWAEREGLAAIALPDHYLMSALDADPMAPAPDALVQFGGLARETSTIELVVLVSPITFRHPAVYAKSAITLDRMSGGRFVLGLGTGWMDAEHEGFGIPYPERAERFAMLEEALAYCRAAFDPTAPGYDGQRYSLAGFDIQPKSDRRVPLLVGGFGPHKTPRLAGTYADEFNVYSGPIDQMRQRIERAREAAATADRDPDALRITTACPPFVGASETDYRAALEAAVPVMGQETADGLHELLERRGFPHGTAEQVADILGQMSAIGVERWYVQARLDTITTESLD
ncbi:MAG: LLM class flavin-dependent oxidoreductase, partial [Acidimicrobiia bacterium]|nr:LLM class flavin-dependent oxidoreductase [Acidimicrobiia bacterium]